MTCLVPLTDKGPEPDIKIPVLLPHSRGRQTPGPRGGRTSKRVSPSRTSRVRRLRVSPTRGVSRVRLQRPSRGSGLRHRHPVHLDPDVTSPLPDRSPRFQVLCPEEVDWSCQGKRGNVRRRLPSGSRTEGVGCGPRGRGTRAEGVPPTAGESRDDVGEPPRDDKNRHWIRRRVILR